MPPSNSHLPRSAPMPLLAAFALLLAAAPVTPRPAAAQQVADSTFAPEILTPSYPPGAGPVVMLDEAHANFHTLAGRYLAFGRLLTRDGYRMRSNSVRLTAAALEGVRVLVIANALNARNVGEWFLPTPSAFQEEECDAIAAWVRGGGSLLLIADHMPFAGAAADLAARFGIHFYNGFAMDPTLEEGRMRFFRRDGSLAAHPITAGRTRADAVDSLTAFTGSAFRLSAPGEPLMTLPAGTVVLLPEEAWQFSRRTPRVGGEGLLQGAALRVGAGRVAVFAEAAMFSAQLSGPEREPAGMNDPIAARNPRFLLNVMAWLTGALPATTR